MMVKSREQNTYLRLGILLAVFFIVTALFTNFYFNNQQAIPKSKAQNAIPAAGKSFIKICVLEEKDPNTSGCNYISRYTLNSDGKTLELKDLAENIQQAINKAKTDERIQIDTPNKGYILPLEKQVKIQDKKLSIEMKQVPDSTSAMQDMLTFNFVNAPKDILPFLNTNAVFNIHGASIVVFENFNLYLDGINKDGKPDKMDGIGVYNDSSLIFKKGRVVLGNTAVVGAGAVHPSKNINKLNTDKEYTTHTILISNSYFAKQNAPAVLIGEDNEATVIGTVFDSINESAIKSLSDVKTLNRPRLKFVNNTFHKVLTPIVVGRGGKVEVTFNIFYETWGATPVKVMGPAGTDNSFTGELSINYNDVYKSTDTGRAVPLMFNTDHQTKGVIRAENNIKEKPEFVDPDKGDFHLTNGPLSVLKNYGAFPYDPNAEKIPVMIYSFKYHSDKSKQLVKLYNFSPTTANLDGWELCTKSTCVTLPSVKLSGVSYLEFPATEFSSWPDIDNKNDMLCLEDKQQRVIDCVNWGTKDRTWSNYEAFKSFLWEKGLASFNNTEVLINRKELRLSHNVEDWSVLTINSQAPKLYTKGDVQMEKFYSVGLFIQDITTKVNHTNDAVTFYNAHDKNSVGGKDWQICNKDECIPLPNFSLESYKTVQFVKRSSNTEENTSNKVFLDQWFKNDIDPKRDFICVINLEDPTRMRVADCAKWGSITYASSNYSKFREYLWEKGLTPLRDAQKKDQVIVRSSNSIDLMNYVSTSRDWIVREYRKLASEISPSPILTEVTTIKGNPDPECLAKNPDSPYKNKWGACVECLDNSQNSTCSERSFCNINEESTTYQQCILKCDSGTVGRTNSKGVFVPGRCEKANPDSKVYRPASLAPGNINYCDYKGDESTCYVIK